MDMQPLGPNQPLTVTLSAQEWNLVMSAVNELPHRIARPIWDKVGQQLQQQSLLSQLPTEDVAQMTPAFTQEETNHE